MSRINGSKFKIFSPKQKCQTETYNKKLPYFPKFETNFSYRNGLRITWFEGLFSQSNYNFENHTNGGSNACTLIVVLMAANCHFNHNKIKSPKRSIKNDLIYSLAFAMLTGNAIHKNLEKKRILVNINLTVPEAIKYGGELIKGIKEWKSELYYQPLALTLYKNIKRHMEEWSNCSLSKTKMSDLYIVLICDFRSVLFVVQNKYETVTLIDSHQHSQMKGALIATVNKSKLKILCSWFSDTIYNYYRSYPKMYELAFLFFKNKQK